MAIKSLTRKHDNKKKGEDVLRNGKQQETDMSIDTGRREGGTVSWFSHNTKKENIDKVSRQSLFTPEV